MKLEQSQKAWVNELVYDNVKFNETYYEILDHVITALEAENDENTTFHQKLNQIWNDDFGGYENLPSLEKQREIEVNKLIGKKHWEIFKSYLKFPLAVITISLSLVFIFISNYLSESSLVVMLLSIAMIPNLVSVFMYWRLKKIHNIKSSIKDKRISKSGAIAYQTFYFIVIIPQIISYLFFDYTLSYDKIYTPIVLLLVIGFCLHTISYLKLYNETFKMELSK